MKNYENLTTGNNRIKSVEQVNDQPIGYTKEVEDAQKITENQIVVETGLFTNTKEEGDTAIKQTIDYTEKREDTQKITETEKAKNLLKRVEELKKELLKQTGNPKNMENRLKAENLFEEITRLGDNEFKELLNEIRGDGKNIQTKSLSKDILVEWEKARYKTISAKIKLVEKEIERLAGMYEKTYNDMLKEKTSESVVGEYMGELIRIRESIRVMKENKRSLEDLLDMRKMIADKLNINVDPCPWEQLKDRYYDFEGTIERELRWRVEKIGNMIYNFIEGIRKR